MNISKEVLEKLKTVIEIGEELLKSDLLEQEDREEVEKKLKYLKELFASVNLNSGSTKDEFMDFIAQMTRDSVLKNKLLKPVVKIKCCKHCQTRSEDILKGVDSAVRSFSIAILEEMPCIKNITIEISHE